ncbi:CPBP family intramembrane glutamic endopeptidase [Natrinema longum]|uniref:CPBP family intramembrane metalloprotease n=1 Tax=Natrinema longum TaxID=370324 RepID=A0A8A2U8Q8_9EURY|nr:CPBP family intramembrane glutamic endopeptidase [Natrinema longum]MBZ6494050.1 CPBP family intramembrane metalloprotease [Natrinema longum]QSW84615.1 CPBP family intramembrane metalloprotease [Natrinema longum]
MTISILARYVDRRHVSDYGFSLSPTWTVDVIAGTGLGILLVGIAFGVASQRGTITIVETLSSGAFDSFVVGMGVAVAGWVLVGFWEETLFRGVFITNAAEGLAARGLPPSFVLIGAWASSSAVYGAFHGPLGSQPDGVGLVYALAMTAVMGGLFGLAYVLSGELAFPIGLHVGINFAEVTLFFGEPGGVIASLLRVERTATASAVQFQSLDPMVIFPVFLLGYVAVVGWFYRRGRTLSIAVLSDSSDPHRPASQER